jgi:hypothetical protein
VDRQPRLERALFRPSTLRPFDKLTVVPSQVEGREPQGRPEPWSKDDKRGVLSTAEARAAFAAARDRAELSASKLTDFWG